MQDNDSQAISTYLREHRQVLAQIAGELAPKIAACAEMLTAQLALGHKILLLGNGGSAADAQHFAAELVGRFRRERRALPAIALTTDTSALTAIGNDYGFEAVFSRQVEALAAPGDVVIGLSTSGNSPNVLAALRAGKDLGCRTVGLLGRDGGSIAGEVELALVVASAVTSHVQEAHITIIHLLCELVERAMTAAQD
ncbi:MAG: phosphoheptose isomerase [Desulfuromonadales bacterium GWD2_61_12]|nr:MAG: phosphoheptose isomerase [Desulfuromonadales bacterium GWC2_61_20]OGR35381.1 MAG: phosphoheptose isomerase [Desulfuromonadales bacterium GWD2_61_12]